MRQYRSIGNEMKLKVSQIPTNILGQSIRLSVRPSAKTRMIHVSFALKQL